MDITASDLPLVLRNLTWHDFDPTRNCTSAGKLFGQALGVDQTAIPVPISYLYLFEFAITCAPVSLQNVTVGQIVDFNSYSRKGPGMSLDVLRDRVRDKCRPEVCRNMKWAGNPDLSGIGVLAAFIIQASLTTIFSAIKVHKALINYRNRKSQEISQTEMEAESMESPSPRESLPSVDKCFRIFWITSFYFGFGTVIAALAISLIENGAEHTMVFSSMSAAFSTSVLLSLWPWYRRLKYTIAHPHLALASILLMVIFIVVIIITYALSEPWSTAGYEVYCFSSLKSKKIAGMLIVAALFPFSVLLAAVAVRWLYTRWRPKRGAWRHAEPFIALMSFLIMWLALGLFIQIRSEMSTMVGSDYADNKWGFGQLLALLAWLPTLVGILNILVGKWVEENVFSKVAPVLRVRRVDQYRAAQNAGVQESDTELVEQQSEVI